MALLLIALPAASAAQGDRAPRAAVGPARCTDRVRPAALRRVPVYARPYLRDSTDRDLLASVDLLTDAIASRTRLLLGAEPGTLPEAEPRVSWRDLGPDLLVTAYRDGRISAQIAPPEPGEAAVAAARGFGATTPAAGLLARAAQAVAAEERFVWPAMRPGDSLQFRVALTWPDVPRRGRPIPIETRFAVPLFSAAVPWEAPARVRRAPQVRYPPPPPGRFAGGSVTLEFVIDSAGRVDARSVRDLWPEDRPRLTGELARHYAAFVDAAKAGLARAAYDPARLGGCRVPQRAQQPFDFVPDP